MAIRDFLYSNFENFDKPTEQEFRVFIDFAGEPTTFENRTIVKTSDILTDLNLEVFILDVRDTVVIFYDVEVYILFGLEGTYGLGGLEIQSENIALIGNASSGALTNSIAVTSSIEGSGISKGTVFPIGTSFEDIWNALLISTTLTNLRFEGTTTTQFTKVDDDLEITKFLWNSDNFPANLVLSDSDGQYNSTVTGNQVTVSETYNYSAYKELTWTITSTDTSPSSFIHYWVEPSYYGRNNTGDIPTSAEILLGTEVLSLTEDGITMPVNTTIQEYGWFAVEAIQANGLYTIWRISDFNIAEIKANSFIRHGGNVVVNGKTYNVYIYNYPSQVTSLTLY